MKILNKTTISHKYIYLIAIYFLLAPMEDILTGSIGTVAKYLAILIVFVGLAENKWKFSLKMSKENVCIFILMIVAIASIIWSVDKTVTMSHWRTYLLLPGITVYISSLKYTKEDYEYIVTAAIIGGIIAGIYMLLSGNIMSSGRLNLSEGNDPNNMAALLFLPATLSWGRMLDEEEKRKIPYVIIFVVIVFVMLRTGSRGGVLALIVMMGSYMLLARMYRRVGVLILIVIFAALSWRFLIPLLPSDMIARMFTFSNYSYNGTGAGRTVIWQIVIKNILPQMSILGLGAGCVSVKLIGYFGFARGVHNTYLNMIGEFGMLGIPVFIFLLASLLIKKIKENYIIGAALLLGMSAIIFFLDSYPKKFFWNVVMLLLIHENSVGEKTEISSEHIRRQP